MQQPAGVGRRRHTRRLLHADSAWASLCAFVFREMGRWRPTQRATQRNSGETLCAKCPPVRVFSSRCTSPPSEPQFPRPGDISHASQLCHSFFLLLLLLS